MFEEFFNRLASPLGILVNRGNPFPRIGASFSSWTKCRGSCQPDRSDRPRGLVLVQPMYMGEGWPYSVVTNPQNIPSEFMRRSRTYSGVSG